MMSCVGYLAWFSLIVWQSGKPYMYILVWYIVVLCHKYKGHTMNSILYYVNDSQWRKLFIPALIVQPLSVTGKDTEYIITVYRQIKV